LNFAKKGRGGYDKGTDFLPEGQKRQGWRRARHEGGNVLGARKKVSR